MITLVEALEMVRSHRVDLGHEAVLLSSALGRLLADDILAPRPSPSFDNSAMDGYAVADPLSGPWTVVGTVAAGSTWPSTLQSGEAVRIFTGAAVPTGALAVVPQEDASLTPLSCAHSLSVAEAEVAEERGWGRGEAGDVQSGTPLPCAHSLSVAEAEVAEERGWGRGEAGDVQSGTPLPCARSLSVAEAEVAEERGWGRGEAGDVQSGTPLSCAHSLSVAEAEVAEERGWGRGEAGDVQSGTPLSCARSLSVAEAEVAEERGRGRGAGEASQLTTSRAVHRGDHIRRTGEEYEAGTKLMTSGTRITPPILGLLASLGLPAVQAKTEPRVGLLCTGSELLKPGTEWIDGKIYESNSYVLKTLLEGFGCDVQTDSVIDDPDRLRDKCQALLASCDLLITVGGVSVGAFDFVEDAMCGLGFTTLFNKVSMKPGRPLTFAIREDGKRWFGLPGNPMSATVTCILAVGTFLGQEPEFFEAILDEDFERKPGREEFIPVQIDFNSGARVCPLQTVGSHATNGLGVADGLIRLPAEGSHFAQGDSVAFMFLPWRLSR
ncbi:MAG: molybdopterin molybdotransferase MoeA [Fimbriimonadaceae bacterium]|nr:molybdopterin molybdotransferase MoeA [Fimbriimonadaceae bacterium]